MGLVQVDVDFFFQMTIPMTAIKATMIMAAIAQMGKLELSPPSLTRIILNEVSPTNVCPLRLSAVGGSSSVESFDSKK